MKKKILSILITILALCTCMFTLTACAGKVEFKINFVVDNQVYATVTTSGSEIIRMPENPTKEDYNFDGWFWDKDVWEKPFTANSLLDAQLSSDMSVYAKFSSVHVCSFTEEVANKDYIATNATCEDKATYFYSCTCGEKGTETFESGEALGHSFTNYVYNNDAKCEQDGNETALCDNGCGEKDTKAKVGSALEHDYSAWVSNGNGTHTRTCSHDSSHNETKDCNGGMATCRAKAVCVDCNTEYGSLAGHVAKEEWSTTNKIHYHACETQGCTEKLDKENHTFDKNKKCTVCDYVTTDLLGTEISSDVFEINGANLFVKVPNSQTSFYFGDVIDVAEGATFKVYADVKGTIEITTYMSDIVVGDNTFYITVSNSGSMPKTYTTTVRRRPMYDVTFNANGGTSVVKQVIEEDDFATEPTTTRAGYDFDGWDYDFATPITKNTEINAIWTARDDTPYKIEYYLQNLANDSYTLAETEDHVGTTDAKSNITPKVIEHFTLHASTLSHTINGNGSTVLKIYYKRDKYDITINGNNAKAGTFTNASGNYKFEKEITLTATTNAGYTFLGWFDGDKCLCENAEYKFNVDKAITITAKWQINVYNVEYKLNGGANHEDNVATYTVETPTITLKNPSRTGYTFNGWFTDETFNNQVTKITLGSYGDKTFYAKWTPIEYTITYHYGYNVKTEIVPENAYTVTNNSTYPWSLSNGVLQSTNKYVRSTSSVYKITANSKITVNFEYKVSSEKNNDKLIIAKNGTALETVSGSTSYVSYSVELNAGDYLTFTYSKDGSTNANSDSAYIKNLTYIVEPILEEVEEEYITTTTYNIETLTFNLVTPTRDGYTFNGWFTEETFENQVTEIPLGSYGDKTFYAKWTANTVSYKIEYYLQNLADDEYTLIETITDSGLTDTTATIEPKDITHFTFNEGYSFNVLESNINGNGSTVLKLYYTRDKYNITVNGNNAKAGAFTNASGTYKFEKEITLTATTNAGYTFLGWFDGETVLSENASYTFNVDKNIEITAKWSADKVSYKIEYYFENVDNTNYSIDSKYTLNKSGITDTPTETAKVETFEHFTYNASHSGNKLSDNINGNGSTVLKLYYTRDKYAITVNGNNAKAGTFTNASGNYKYDKEITVKATTNIGYTFLGWFDGDKCLCENAEYKFNVDKAITITAKWSVNTVSYKIEYYLQNLADDEYTLIETTTDSGLTDTTATIEPKDITHFTFNEGYSLNVLESNINGNETTVLKLYYTRNKYTLSINNSNAGKITNAGTYKYGSDVKISEITLYLGYDFIGWYSGDELLSEELTYTFTGTQNVVAKFIVKEEMSDFNFTSTTTTCQITGIKDKTLTEIIVPNYVTSISSSAFSGCTSLTSITLPFVGAKAGVTSSDAYQYPFGYIFGTTSFSGSYSAKQYYYGSSTSSATNSTYYIPSRLKSVTITGGNILYGAFSNCSSLTSIVIPDSVTNIGDRAFEYCSKLTSVEIGDSVTSIGSYAFEYCSKLTSVEIGDSVTSIGSYAFAYCDSLTSVVIGDSVTSIGESAFFDCSSLTSIKVTENNNYYKDIDGNLYSKDGTTLLRYTIGKTDSSFIIPDSVTSIGERAFYGCTAEIIWGDNPIITEIGSYAFYGYEGTSITIPDSVTSIGGDAFYGCDSLTSVVIPDSVTSIGYEAFYSCDSLTSVVIGDSVTSIGDSAFEYCDSLTSVVIGDSVTSIGDSAFDNCDSLTSVVIPDNITSIGERAFYGCNSLTSVVIGDSVTSIGSEAFRYCDSLISVVIGNSVTSIGYEAFGDCSSLTKVNYTGTIDQWAQIEFVDDAANPIYYAKKLYINGELVTQANITTATKINEYAFDNCDSLTSVTIGDSVTSIGGGAFYNCGSLTSVVIGGSVTSIGDYAFDNCDSLTSVVIGDSVTSIGWWAFYGCTSLTSIKYRGTESQWGAIAKGGGWDLDTGYYRITYNYKG